MQINFSLEIMIGCMNLPFSSIKQVHLFLWFTSVFFSLVFSVFSIYEMRLLINKQTEIRNCNSPATLLYIQVLQGNLIWDSRCCFLETFGILVVIFVPLLANGKATGKTKPQPIGKAELPAKPERNTLLVIFVLIVFLTLAIGKAEELWYNMYY